MVETPRVGAAARARSRQRGATLLGFMVGLMAGLAIAVVVALFVTRAPVPFVNKTQRSSDRSTEPRNGQPLPDPNLPLQTRPRETPSTPPAETPGVLAQPPIIPPAPPVAPSGTSVPTPAAGSAGAPSDSGYMLQAGAFKAPDDAEGMKARLALLGFEARVMSAEVNGQTVYRVRIGPFAQQEEANRARSRLADGGIEASVTRQR